MWYNPSTYRWEGNENDLSPFDQVSTPSTASVPSHYFREKEIYREKENSTPRPALIQNVNSSQNVQVVGGMGKQAFIPSHLQNNVLTSSSV